MLLIHLKFLKIAENPGTMVEMFGPGIERIFLWCRSGLELFVCLKLWSWPLVSIYYMSIGGLLYLDVSFKRLCWQEAFFKALSYYIFLWGDNQVVCKSYSFGTQQAKTDVKAGLSYSLDASGTGAWWMARLSFEVHETPRNAASPQHRSRVSSTLLLNDTPIKFSSDQNQFFYQFFFQHC